MQQRQPDRNSQKRKHVFLRSHKYASARQRDFYASDYYFFKRSQLSLLRSFGLFFILLVMDRISNINIIVVITSQITNLKVIEDNWYRFSMDCWRNIKCTQDRWQAMNCRSWQQQSAADEQLACRIMACLITLIV